MTGIGKITTERQHQLLKGYTPANDVVEYSYGDLTFFARYLMMDDCDAEGDDMFEYITNKKECGMGIDPLYVTKLSKKSYIDRLAIAGALIAAEIDRELKEGKIR